MTQEVHGSHPITSQYHEKSKPPDSLLYEIMFLYYIKIIIMDIRDTLPIPVKHGRYVL